MFGLLFNMAGMIQSAAQTFQGMLTSYPPFVNANARRAFDKRPNMLPDISSFVAMRYKGEIEPKDYTAKVREIGFDDDMSEAFFHAGRRMLDAREYIVLWRRGKLSPEALDSKLGKLGLKQSERDLAIKVTEYFPSPIDLVRFAVREVYTPDIVHRFGMGQDLPAEFVSEGWKAGLSREQAENYWKAHWDLPSAGQGFEMYQRGVITWDELTQLLRALDIMPFWRDRLTEIAYNPLPRVDIRRMHKLGLLEAEDLQQRYQAFGYSPDNASKMAEFTIAYNTDEERGATRAIIMDAYEKHINDEEETRSLLLEIGYTLDTVNLYMDLADWDKSLREVEDTKSELITQYRRGMITRDDLAVELGATGVPSLMVENAVAEIERDISKRVRLPTKADLDRWFNWGTIDEVDYARRLAQLGYQEGDIQHYLEAHYMDPELKHRQWASDTVYQRWLIARIISEETFTQVMDTKGKSDLEIAGYIQEARSKRGPDETT